MYLFFSLSVSISNGIAVLRARGPAGLNELAGMPAFLAEIARAHQAHRVLIDTSQMAPKLSFTDHFLAGTKASVALHGFEQVATVVPEGYLDGPGARAARLSGLNIKTFLDSTPALDWLGGKPETASSEFVLELGSVSQFMRILMRGPAGLIELRAAAAYVAELATRRDCKLVLINLLGVAPRLTFVDHLRLGDTLAHVFCGLKKVASIVPLCQRKDFSLKVAQLGSAKIQTFCDLPEAEAWIAGDSG